MYQTHKTYITPEMKMADLILENHTLLMLLEHFEIDFTVGDKSVGQICKENNIPPSVFLLIANLYNQFYPNKDNALTCEDIPSIIRFLRNSHRYYTQDIYPEIKASINQLHQHHHTDDIKLIEKFFDSYFREVLEHLNYEEKVAFPYFCQLTASGDAQQSLNFSGNHYKDHHSDIETKLSDLKNLMLKHIHLKGDFATRRKFLKNLFELEFDLNIHSMIEETVLLPLITQIENERLNG